MVQVIFDPLRTRPGALRALPRRRLSIPGGLGWTLVRQVGIDVIDPIEPRTAGVI